MSSMAEACVSDTIVKEWVEADCDHDSTATDAIHVVCHKPGFDICDGNSRH